MPVGVGIGVMPGGGSGRNVPRPVLLVDEDGNVIEDEDHPGFYWVPGTETETIEE